MKALSVKQPWAYLIANGSKTIETRTWKTSHRGPLLICASKSDEKKVKAVQSLMKWITRLIPKVDLSPFAEAKFEFGKAIAIVDVVDCRPMRPEDTTAACIEYKGELYAWVLENPRPVEPFHVRGMPGFFEVADDLIKINTNDEKKAISK